MKHLFYTFLLILWMAGSSAAQNSELIIIGNVHRPMPGYNADSLYMILEQLSPDIILLELDSSNFTADNRFKESSPENEQVATTKYVARHPSTAIGPFEFEGRNNYRRIKGIKQSEEPAMKLLDSLFASGRLNREQSGIITAFRELTEALNAFGYKTARHFNNAHTDSIAAIRQYAQHHQVRKVINQRKEFKAQFVATSTGEQITLCEGYNRFCDFWDLRNKTMAKNINSVVKRNPGKKIVVLTGYYHRYYLIAELQKAGNRGSFLLKEFYE